MPLYRLAENPSNDTANSLFDAILLIKFSNFSLSKLFLKIISGKMLKATVIKTKITESKTIIFFFLI
ncbi:MAG: hypothetical protein OEZ13_01325 [Spirochaetia bacterium]|nr:hypothetical protein [Spirochaetia bacterium]